MNALESLSTVAPNLWLNAAAAWQDVAGDEVRGGRLIKFVVESAVFVGMGLLLFLIAFIVMTKVAPFSLRKEIEEDQNTALGVVMGSVIIGLAIIIAAAIGE
ncbi:MAG: DUF350 domain-containing protein [Myxococcota bacterium]